jgi:RND family efflux transporter MFP subunit
MNEGQYEKGLYAKKIERSKEPKPQKTLRILAIGIAKILVAALILVGAFAAYRYQMNTSPRAGRKKPPPQPKLVQVIPARKADGTTTVTGDGIVMPAQKVMLRPQVTGQLMEISDDVVPGGIVRAGQKLMAIDYRDYDILVRQRQYEVARARKDLKLEQGSQAIARQEYELLGEVISEEDRELVLREPQLASAQAAEESAKAALKKAQLDLSRCDIVTPFNAIIQDKHVDLGATVSVNTNLVTLMGTDEAWIEVKVWIDKLKWLTIPRQNGEPGSSVKIFNALAWGADRYRTGRVVCLIGELETQGRLARLLVAVDDPFCLKPENRDQPQLLMGSYVSAEIQGRTLSSVFPVKWPHLRGENNEVWIMDDEDNLEIRPVQVVFSDVDQVYVTEGLAESEKLIVTDITAPVEGMPLRIASGEGQGPEPQSRAPSQKGGQK